MRMIDVIAKKRDGEALSSDEIRSFIADYTSGDIPDYQTAALLMAIYFKGMNRKETVELTMAIAESAISLICTTRCRSSSTNIHPAAWVTKRRWSCSPSLPLVVHPSAK